MIQTTASSILIYGVSDSYKTTQIPEFARFVRDQTGRSIRLVSAETAGADRLQPAIDAGLIEPFWLTANPRSALVHVAKGDWPVAIDANRQPTTDPARAVGWMWAPTTNWSKIGGYAFEGTTTFAEAIIRDLINKGRKIQEEIVGQYEEEGVKLGAAARSHFGVAQQDVLRLLSEAPKQLFDASGGNVRYVLFTGHESKGEDDQKATIYGVGMVGKAAVKSVPKWVGTLLHHEVDKAARDEKGRAMKRVFAYFQPHADLENPNILWDAKANLPAHPKVWALANKKWPGGRMELTFDQTLYNYLAFQEQAKKFVAEELAKTGPAATAAAVDNPTTEKEK